MTVTAPAFPAIGVAFTCSTLSTFEGLNPKRRLAAAGFVSVVDLGPMDDWRGGSLPDTLKKVVKREPGS